jgi:hypothetical protein
MSAEMSLTELFEAYYGRRLADAVSVGEDTPWLHSYVPFVRGQTHVIAYNFLRDNYNLRDPVLLRVWVTGPGILDSPRVLNRIFASDEVVHFEPDQLDALVEFDGALGSVHLQLLHPRVATANGEFRFLAYYHAPGAGCAGIHSLGARGLHYLGSSFGSRAVLADGRIHHAVDPVHVQQVHAALEGDLLSRTRSIAHPLKGPAFFVSTDAHCRISAVWHDSDMTQTLLRRPVPEPICPIRQVFPVVDFPTGAPTVWVDPGQIGFAPARLRFIAHDAGGHVLADRTSEPGAMPGVIKLAELFSDASRSRLAYIVTDFGADHGQFEVPALAYLQLWYPGSHGAGDQVHSQITPSYWTDPLAEPVPYRCRKFAPWSADARLEWRYAIANIGGVGGNRDESVRFRICTDDRRERVIDLPVPDERVAWFDGTDLIRECGLDGARSAIVQIEAETTNFNAFWLVSDRQSGAHGIDHFTGG